MTLQSKSCIMKIQSKSCIFKKGWLFNMNKQNFIESIKKIRKKKGLSQAALSESTGISQQVLSRTEQTNSNPTLDTLISIANAMKCDILFAERDAYINLQTNREWLDEKSNLINQKTKVQNSIKELQCDINKAPESHQAQRANKILERYKISLAELNNQIENYKTGTVAQFYKNLKNSIKHDYGYDPEDDVYYGYDPEAGEYYEYDSEDIEDITADVNKEIEEFTSSITNVAAEIKYIEQQYLYISYGLFDCIEACKDLCAILNNKQNIIELEVIKNISNTCSATKDAIDELSIDMNSISSTVEEIVAVIEENL